MDSPEHHPHKLMINHQQYISPLSSDRIRTYLRKKDLNIYLLSLLSSVQNNLVDNIRLM